MDSTGKIPHIIHYCWFGGNPLPDLAKKCIESWKKYCPDFEIKEWNESNYDVNVCPYVKEAYEAKKWAFVSDYARFDILYRYGGIYFDTDVELIRPIDDIISSGSFFAVELFQNGMNVAPGLGMASVAEHPIYEQILSEYNNRHFLNPDGSLNQTTVVKYTTDVLRKAGLGDLSNLHRVSDIWIYPWDYFCPMQYHTREITITNNTRSIHHYSASWFSKQELALYRFGVKASKLFGVKIGYRLRRIYSFPYRVRMKVKQKGFFGAVRFAMNKIKICCSRNKNSVR